MRRKKESVGKNSRNQRQWHHTAVTHPTLGGSLHAVYIVAAAYDPLLDDAVEFAKRTRSAGVPTKLRVFQRLSHGFLNFVGGAELLEAQQYWIECLRETLQRPMETVT